MRVLVPCVAALAGGVAAIAAPAPVIFQSGPGRFEIAAADVALARAATAAADEAWRALAAPLGLPEGFSSPVLVRLVPAAEWAEVTPFRVVVESGGLVSVRVGAGGADAEAILARALVQGLLLRLAVTRHGVQPRLAVPLWLEHACVGWWRAHAAPAQLDRAKQESAQLRPPRLGDLLGWTRGAPEPREHVVGALWLMAFLQGEAARPAEWHGFVQRLLGGEDAAAALAAGYAGRFRDTAERELWWQSGWHDVRRTRTLPTLESGASRDALEALSRFVFAEGGSDRVVPLREVLAHGREPLVDAEVVRRTMEVNRLVPSLHPFFRNAGLSLADAFAARALTPAKCDEACARFESDWRDALELQAAAAKALDGLERARP